MLMENLIYGFWANFNYKDRLIDNILAEQSSELPALSQREAKSHAPPRP